MSTRILTLSATAPQATVFNFLADIENLPAWTDGFCEWIELHRDGWWAYTALGELAVETKVDDIASTIDLRLRPVAGWSIVIPLHVRTDGEGGALVSVVCRQPAGLAGDDFEQLFESLLRGLHALPMRLPPALVVV